MPDNFSTRMNIPREDYDFAVLPETPSGVTFRSALRRARKGIRLRVEDGIELMTAGTDREGIDPERKQRVLDLADERRAEVAGDRVTFVANLNNNVTTACNIGCLFCNFKDPAHRFRSEYDGSNEGFTKTPEDSRDIVREHVRRGIYEVCSVSGLHPALALNEDHRDRLETDPVNYEPTETFDRDPGTYVDQMRAMSVDGVHVHSMTPEEASHARRGTDWSYERVYETLARAGLDSVPGTAAEILVDEVRDVICPGKIGTEEWMDAMRAAARVGLPMTSTIMYGHVENEAHRVHHLKRIRDLQEETGSITEFVPLKFIYPETPLYERDMVSGSSTSDEDELMIAVSRLFLDNIDNIQSSWVKYGDEKGLDMLECGANDFMGTLLSEEITRRAGGSYGEFRSFQDYRNMIRERGRIPCERSTDYQKFNPINGTDPPGPTLGPHADGTPLLKDLEQPDEATRAPC